MATLTLRSQKGSPLTNQEVDDNFSNLNSSKLEVSGGTLTGPLSVTILTSSNVNGDEGGKLLLAKPATNTTIDTSVTVKLHQNKLQIFETGGTYRGAHLDITTSAADIGSKILTSSNIGSYAPTLTGVGASGTWSINISGNSATVTGITSSQVTSALGYTPYNNSNPSGYITGYTETDTLATVTARGATTSTSVILSSTGNHYQGHLYIDAYESGGNHYPHFLDGSSNSGVKVNWRLYTGGTNTHTHYWGTDTALFATKLESTSRVDAPIFYDRNDTNYYVDPASTSNLNAVVATVGTFTNNGSSRVLYLKGSGNIIQFQDADGTDRWENVGRNGIYYVYKGYGTGSGYKWQIDDSGNQTFNGIVTFNTDARAPIFYDSNDTNYYVNPNGVSVFSEIRPANGNWQAITGNTGQNLRWRALAGSSDLGFSFYDANDNWRMQLYASSGNYGFLNGNWASWDMRKVPGAELYLNNQSSYYLNGSEIFYNRVYGNTDIRSPIFYDYNDTNFYADPAGYSRFNALNLSHGRLDANERFPVGHYSSGETVFEIDTMWTDTQLQAYFNSSGVSWVADSTSPGGYAIQISGAVSVGGEYASGFPYIPVEQDDIFYMECWIKDVSGTNGHYMGSMDYNHNLSSLGGNPGSYGYWVMSNSFPGTSWQKYSAYITGFGSSTGQFVSGTKYWTPQALFNYSGGGTSYISGWKVTKVNQRGKKIIQAAGLSGGTSTTYQLQIQNSAGASTAPDLTFGADGSYTYIQSFNSKPLLVNNQGNYAQFTDVRSPIYYDSQNTAYYLDPNSTSNMNTVTATNFRMGNALYLGGNNYYINNNDTWFGSNASFRSSSDIRGNLFYDNDNTGYYWDGASTSKWNESNQNGWHTFNNYGLGITGTYDSYRLQTVFAMGSAYRMAADGASTANMYGLAWSHPNAGSLGGANNLNDHGLLLINAGSFRAAISSRAVFSADVRGTLFYDYNDTGYYLNPNGTSQLSYVLANDWFRSQGSTGLYFQDYDYGIRSAHGEGNSYGNAATYGAGRNGWNGWGIGSRHCFMSTGGDNVGVHDNSRGWIWYWDGTYTQLPYGYTYMAGSSRSPIFYDSDNTGYYCDPNGNTNVAGSITAGGNITAYSDLKLKANINTITNAIELVNKLRGVTFTRIDLADKEKQHIGVIAQEVEQYLPQVVENNGTSKSVAYGNITALLIEAVKEQQQQIENQQQQLADLTQLVKTLVTKLAG